MPRTGIARWATAANRVPHRATALPHVAPTGDRGLHALICGDSSAHADERAHDEASSRTPHSPYSLLVSEVRRTGDNVWRPGATLRLAWLVLGVAFLAGTGWLASDGALSLRDKVLFGAADVAAVTPLPVVLFRWRMVLEADALYLVFLRVRRVPVRDIVDAKAVPKDGLTFVLRDGQTESFGALGNTAWGHRRASPTRADLAARAVLRAAAEARGEEPPGDYRLTPMRGLRKAAIEGGIWAAIVGLLIGN